MSQPEAAFLLDFQSPLRRAERCLTQWLAAQKLGMNPLRQRQATALITRYFYEEEGLDDAIIFSFLNRIAGQPAVDPDNIGDVENELRRLIGQAQKDAEKPPLRFYTAALVAIVLLLSILTAQNLLTPRQVSAPLTSMQQAELKILVDDIVRLERTRNNRDITPHAVWAEVKKPLMVRRYEDIPQTEFAARKAFLQDWRNRLSL